MPNRTISLDDVSDAIRKEITSTGMPFSQFVKLALRAWKPSESEEKVKPKPPKHYMCRHCLGEHWTADCEELRA